MKRNIKNDSIWIFELSFEIFFPLVSKIEEKFSARLFDFYLRFSEIIYLKTKMIGANRAFRIGEVISLFSRKI